MDAASTTSSSGKSHNLFQVYLRLRPPQAGAGNADRFLAVEPPATNAASTAPTHITLNPPNDRRRAVEKFCFTQVFEEDATQLDVFHCTGVVPLVEGVLAPHGGDGTDALLATLGVTGSGKSHTILGSRSQRGLTQLSLDVIFRSLGHNIIDCNASSSLEHTIAASDASDAAIFPAAAFLETVYADFATSYGPASRAATPMIVGSPNTVSFRHAAQDGHSSRFSAASGLDMPGAFPRSPSSARGPRKQDPTASCVSVSSLAVNKSSKIPREAESSAPSLRSPARSFMCSTPSTKQKKKSFNTKTSFSKGEHPSAAPPPTPRRLLARPSVLPQNPDVSSINVSSDPNAEYAVLVSMYEVYNDRIFDLLTPPVKSATTKEYRRRPLLFKSTEMSPDRKVVAGLRKIICSTLGEALLVLEAGLHERRVAGTGSNSVSSRSHGFFCIEVKKRAKGRRNEYAPWGGSTLTIVDLAGSERARDAKTAGATLAEAGKINESLMYLGQCLQMQSDAGSSSKPNVVPFRQCKLTELLFSNSFPSPSLTQSSHAIRRNPQKAVMIVTADPHGDFNATSQILRYSALAREITVPRIPSITQTILAASASAHHTGAGAALPLTNQGPCSSPVLAHAPLHHRPFFPPGNTSTVNTATIGGGGLPSPNIQRTFSPCSNASSSEDRVTMEIAALEIARLHEEAEYLRSGLAEEARRRNEAEAHLLSLGDRLLELEQEIREDCAAEFEARLALELARCRATLDVEKERAEEHCDRKVEVLEQLHISVTAPVDIYEDAPPAAAEENKENVLIENLEEENARLRRELAVLKRELAGRSPVKRRPLHSRDDMPTCDDTTITGSNNNNNNNNSPRPSRGAAAVSGDGGLHRKMERLRVSDDGNNNNGRVSSASGRSDGGSPKKMRKLANRKWDVSVDGDDMF